MTYISNTAEDQKKMLETIGVSSVEALFKDIPKSKFLTESLNLPKALTEIELKNELSNIAAKNKAPISFLGAGSYQHYIPATVKEIVSRQEFYTAYTPYQPEISQGTLQALFEYQSMICQLTGMDVSNASMYDGATSFAEAMIMATKIQNKKEVLVSKTVHPSYREVLKTYAWANHISITEIEDSQGQTDLKDLQSKLTDQTAAVMIQSPNFFGIVEELTKLRSISNCMLITTTTESLSWALLKPFASYGVDIVTGEGQSFGNPVTLGGPALGIMAVKQDYMRQIPGRLVGQTVDVKGQRSFVLTLSAREQHIRREKATSNICSNEGLCALSAAVYLATLGKQLKKLAQLNHQLATYFSKELAKVKGIEIVFNQPFFNEFVIKIDPNLKSKLKEIELGIDLGKFYPKLKDCKLICCTELTPKNVIDEVLKKLT